MTEIHNVYPGQWVVGPSGRTQVVVMVANGMAWLHGDPNPVPVARLAEHQAHEFGGGTRDGGTSTNTSVSAAAGGMLADALANNALIQRLYEKPSVTRRPITKEFWPAWATRSMAHAA